MSYLRTQITGRLKTLLEGIRKSAGSRTDAGSTVFVGKLKGNANDAPCIYLVPGVERGADIHGATQTEVDYTASVSVKRADTSISGYASDPKAEWVIIDALIADVREVVEGRDAQLHALIDSVLYQGSEPYYHEDAGEVVEVDVSFTVRFTTVKGDLETKP